MLGSTKSENKITLEAQRFTSDMLILRLLRRSLCSQSTTVLGYKLQVTGYK